MLKINRKDLNAASPLSDALVDLHGVTKTYQSDGGPCLALAGIDLHIKEGEFVAVVGKSGSGKSTLINMITGIDRLSGGEMWVTGVSVHTLNENQLAIWRGRAVGVVFQFFQLLPTLTVLENVMLPMDLCGCFRGPARAQRALQLLEEVEIADQAHKFPAQLSGGQQQRVAIARALANDPPLIVADEPTGNLDSRTTQAVVALFVRLAQKGKTILMVTHDPDLARRASRRVCIADGLIVEDSLTQAPL